MKNVGELPVKWWVFFFFQKKKKGEFEGCSAGKVLFIANCDMQRKLARWKHMIVLQQTPAKLISGTK